MRCVSAIILMFTWLGGIGSIGHADDKPARTPYGVLYAQWKADRLLQELRSPVAIGKSAPEMKGETLEKTPFVLSEHQRKVVVLSFSGHWCGPCRAMHSVQKRLMEKYTRKDLVIVEINSDKPEQLQAVSRKVQEDGLHWPLISDGGTGPLAERWHVTSWPTFCVLDRQHNIRHRASGNIGEQLGDWVNHLINEPAQQ